MSKAEKPDPSAFSVNEKPNEYRVHCKVSGEVMITINAESPSEAHAKVEAMIKDKPENFELLDPDEIEVAYVRKTPPMYRVMRDGQPMQVSRLEAGDLPREPDAKYGF